MANKKERVVFRRDYDPYANRETYLACFPDDEANWGNIACVPIFFNYGAWHEPYTEIPYEYFYSKPIIRKTDPIVDSLVKALEKFYEGNYKVVERIMVRR